MGELETLGMDKIFRSVALVKKIEGNYHFLLSRKAGSDCWEFVVADRLNQESFRESVTREVAWQLDLDRKSDFIVSSMAQLSMEYVETRPDGSHQHVAVAFYNVHIYQRAMPGLQTASATRQWLTAAEVCQGATSDDQPVDPQVVKWINKWSVVQPWQ